MKNKLLSVTFNNVIYKSYFKVVNFIGLKNQKSIGANLFHIAGMYCSVTSGMREPIFAQLPDCK